jgi:predicted TIM-barrel fold metal-dependent hydrolase
MVVLARAEWRPRVSGSITEFVEQLTLVDHHVHGAFRTDGPESRFQNALNEANPEPLTRPDSAYDSQLGFAIRRWCAEALDLPRHPSTAEYWQRRVELGETEVTRRLTSSAGVSDWLLDTGFEAGQLCTPTELSSASGATSHEIVRLESVAERLIVELDDPGGFADAVRADLAGRGPEVVGAKSIIAYRTGFDIDLSRPSDVDVAESARRWRDQIERERSVRLTDPVLLRFGIQAAIDRRLPLQLHVGFGDRDIDLRAANPLHLLDFLRAHEATGVPILLLHCYPFEREAGYLAQAFETVHLDVGLAINHVGARSRALIARSLELAPFAKILYSSDALGPAELHYLGARLWRNAMASIVGGWVDDDDWSEVDARRVLSLVARDNARRVYDLA